MNWTTLSNSYKQSHRIFVLLWLANFAQHNVLKVHSCVLDVSEIPPFQGCMFILLMRLTFYLKIETWVASTSELLLAVLSSEHECTNISLRPCFQVLWFIPKSGIIEWDGSSTLQEHDTVFHSGCTILYPYQWYSGFQFFCILSKTYILFNFFLSQQPCYSV